MTNDEEMEETEYLLEPSNLDADASLTPDGARFFVDEGWLRYHKVEVPVPQYLPLSEVDEQASARNSARIDQRIDQDHLGRLVENYKAGDILPPLIAARQRRGKLVLIGGHHRYLAAKRLRKKNLWFYVVTVDPLQFDVLTETHNSLLGKSETQEQLLEHAIHLVNTQHLDIKAAALKLRMTPKRLAEHMRITSLIKRLTAMNIDHTDISKSHLRRLVVIHSDATLDLVTSLIHRARLPEADTATLIADVQTVRTEADQAAVVAAWECRPDVQELLRHTSSGETRVPQGIRDRKVLTRDARRIKRILLQYENPDQLNFTPEQWIEFSSLMDSCIHLVACYEEQNRWR